MNVLWEIWTNGRARQREDLLAEKELELAEVQRRFLASQAKIDCLKRTNAHLQEVIGQSDKVRSESAAKMRMLANLVGRVGTTIEDVQEIKMESDNAVQEQKSQRPGGRDPGPGNPLGFIRRGT